MNLKSTAALAAAAILLPLAVQAQNVAVVNGKPVQKARVDMLIKQATKGGQPATPELQARARDEVVMREIFVQEAEKKGILTSAAYKEQMELLRQTVLIRELFEDYKKKHPATEEEAKAEYEKVKAAQSGTEYRARHILVENEDDAKKLIAQIKAGGSFEELAKKNSKDPGSAENGGDLDFAKPDSYVPEFSAAMTALKKGEITETPVKTQFGYHIIKLEESREASFPAFDEVKPQLMQRVEQTKLQKYQDDLKKAAKTDYKWAQQ
ncbi:peptidylprolyl isomerase [Ideonella sp. DXS29W]|uniref:peptidylprolyl isomerase n=1 Tax=Ideonella lacteola TaxID=2984193 RepID=A0ABU9BU62_9BURK